MQTKLLFGKVKCKLNEELPHVHYPLKDKMHKAVLPSHWSHYLELLSHSTWHSTISGADIHQVWNLSFAGKMAKIHSYMDLLSTGEGNTLNTQTFMRTAATVTDHLHMKDNPQEVSVVSDLCPLDHQQGSSTRAFPARFSNISWGSRDCFLLQLWL